jgi:hypothetical protein
LLLATVADTVTVTYGTLPAIVASVIAPSVLLPLSLLLLRLIPLMMMLLLPLMMPLLWLDTAQGTFNRTVGAGGGR